MGSQQIPCSLDLRKLRQSTTGGIKTLKTNFYFTVITEDMVLSHGSTIYHHYTEGESPGRPGAVGAPVLPAQGCCQVAWLTTVRRSLPDPMVCRDVVERVTAGVGYQYPFGHEGLGIVTSMVLGDLAVAGFQARVGPVPRRPSRGNSGDKFRSPWAAWLHLFIPPL